MKEYSNDYARMRSYEIIAAREGISANESNSHVKVYY
jgi:hypothetical protein